MVQVTTACDQFAHHREELFLHGAAQAAIGQFVHPAVGFFFGAADRALLEDFSVDAQLAELIDDDRNAPPFGVVEHVPQQGGLARAEEAGDDGDGKLGQCFHQVPFGNAAGKQDENRMHDTQIGSPPDHPARL